MFIFLFDLLYAQSISVDSIKSHLEFLAGDSCFGRASGTIGGKRAAAYLRDKVSVYNLEPLGDNGTYFQKVPMHGSIPLAQTSLKLYTISGIPNDNITYSF